MKPIMNSGLMDAAQSLIEFCGTTRKYFSSAPMKLAACITIMNGGDADYVLRQYRALCNLDFDAMSNSAKSLVRQVEIGKTRSNETREVLARGMRVFDKSRHEINRVQVSNADIDAAVDLVRSVLRNRAK
jgi:hypothetical protein